jgi:hypothetical protein
VSVITNNSFKSPVVGLDPVTKGTFVIEWAHVLLDYYDWDDDKTENTRASGAIRVDGIDNPLFVAIEEHPLRMQGLVASVMFGLEKKFIKFTQITNYTLIDEGLDKEIGFNAVFDILDNLEYLEKVIEYKDDHNIQ